MKKRPKKKGLKKARRKALILKRPRVPTAGAVRAVPLRRAAKYRGGAAQLPKLVKEGIVTPARAASLRAGNIAKARAALRESRALRRLKLPK